MMEASGIGPPSDWPTAVCSLGTDWVTGLSRPAADPGASSGGSERRLGVAEGALPAGLRQTQHSYIHLHCTSWITVTINNNTSI